MIGLDDTEDGLDEAGWERAMSRLPRRRPTRTTARLPNPAERMDEIVPPAPPAEPLRPGHPIAPHDGVALPRTRTQRIEVLP